MSLSACLIVMATEAQSGLAAQGDKLHEFEPPRTASAKDAAMASDNAVAKPLSEIPIGHNGRPRIGLALGGGGTRGVAHAAVLRVLENGGIPVDCIAGTSMGAIVGGLYSAGFTPEQIHECFRDRSMLKSYQTVPIPLRVALIPFFAIPRLFGHHPYDGLYRGNKFANYIDNKVPENRRNIEGLKIPFVAVASNLLDGKPYTIAKGDLGRALQGSSAIPQLRRPLPWQDQLLVDGGVVANLPVDQCRNMGADIVIAVDVDEELCTLADDHFRKVGSVSYRCLNMYLTTLDRVPMSRADFVIHPDVAGIELLSSKDCDIQEAYHRGEKAAEAALPGLTQLIKSRIEQTRAAAQ
jgi:NTE family protein